MVHLPLIRRCVFFLLLALWFFGPARAQTTEFDYTPAFCGAVGVTLGQWGQDMLYPLADSEAEAGTFILTGPLWDGSTGALRCSAVIRQYINGQFNRDYTRGAAAVCPDATWTPDPVTQNCKRPKASACAPGNSVTQTWSIAWRDSPTDSASPSDQTGPATYCDGACLHTLTDIPECRISTTPGASGKYEATCDYQYTSSGAECSSTTTPPSNPEPGTGGPDGGDPDGGDPDGGDPDGGDPDGGDPDGGDPDGGDGGTECGGEGQDPCDDGGSGTGGTGGTTACTQEQIAAGLCSCTTPTGQPSQCGTGGGTGPGTGTGTEDDGEDCPAGSDSLACARLGTAPTSDGIVRADRNITWTPDNILGTSASCPPDKTVSIMGRTFTITRMSTVCGWLSSYVRPMAILLASFFAVFIVAGATKGD